MMLEMDVADAVARFTVLTVGDGVVSQIPSLLVSVAAGVLITRVSSTRKDGGGALGSDIVSQIADQPRSFVIAGLLMLALCAVPGLPLPPFLVFGLLMLGVALLLKRTAASEAVVDIDQIASLMPDHPKPKAAGEGGIPRLGVAPASLLLSAGDYRALDSSAFDRCLWSARERLLSSVGLPFPGLLIGPSDEVDAGSYLIRIQGVDFDRGDLAGAASAGSDPMGAASDSEDVAQRLVDALEVAITRSAPDLLTFSETQSILRRLATDCPELAADLGKAVTTIRVVEVLRRLLQESVSIRNIQLIAESLLSWGSKEKDPILLTERVRCDLARQITNALAPEGRLSAITVAPRLEDAVRSSLQQTPNGVTAVIDPEVKSRVLATFGAIYNNVPDTEPCAVICAMDVRPHLAKMISLLPRRCSVLSHGELAPGVKLNVLGAWDVA
jgi:type III secretion protein V